MQLQAFSDLLMDLLEGIVEVEGFSIQRKQASFECEDLDGSTFTIRILQTQAADVAEEDPEDDLEDVPDLPRDDELL